MMVVKQTFCKSVLFLLPLLFSQLYDCRAYRSGGGFATTSGTHFTIDGLRPFHPNGFNAYWLMMVASEPAERGKVTSAFQQASDYGMSVVRTWAFSDGGYNPLQYSPGYYNEEMFKGLDFVILSLANNFDDFGGKKQYVQWAIMHGESLISDDEFYNNRFDFVVQIKSACMFHRGESKIEPVPARNEESSLIEAQLCECKAYSHGGGFVRTSGTHFTIDGLHPIHPNGFNAYWMMVVASDPAERGKVTSAFQQASDYGMSVVRTWAFSDGGYSPLQYSPGSYNEEMFKGLDFVISEAQKFGVYLILSLANNFDNFGGKKQYVQWATMHGESLISDDEFYNNRLTKKIYKKHVQAVITRINTITGVAYKDDPTIFAWELMNEPNCESDLSGRTLQMWVEEMAAHVKAIDRNHLVQIGLEGFYGESMPEKREFNPAGAASGRGSDFIANNNITGIDFTTIHAYPREWLPGSSNKAQLAFLRSWIRSHSQDASVVLKKPLLISEFGTPSASGCATSEVDSKEMMVFYRMVYRSIDASVASGRGACAGGLFWQLLMPGMDALKDGYEVVLSECSALSSFFSLHSDIISTLGTIRPPLASHHLKNIMLRLANY